MLRILPCLAVLFSLALHVPTASASPSNLRSEVHASRPRAKNHALYLEAFGKGGLYGVGYDYRWARRLGVGLALSAYEVDSERILSASPYLSAYPLIQGPHALFTQIGPQLVHRRVTSPVPLWQGARTTSLRAQISSGYEYRNRVVLRAFVMGVAGRGGISPWAGMSLGVAF